jgi:hypothetical protein
MNASLSPSSPRGCDVSPREQSAVMFPTATVGAVGSRASTYCALSRVPEGLLTFRG